MAAAASILNDGADDDDRYVTITTSYPSDDQTEADRWKDEGLKEYALYLGQRDNRFYVRYTRGAMQRMTIPFLIAGRAQDWNRGKYDALTAGVRFFGDLGRVGVPAYSSTTRFYGTFEDAGEKQIKRDLSFRVAPLTPWSGVARSARDILQGRVEQTDDNVFWANQPWYALFQDAEGLGSVEQTDAFGRPLKTRGGGHYDIWHTLNQLGIPVGFLPE